MPAVWAQVPADPWQGSAPPGLTLSDPVGATPFLKMRSRFDAGEGRPAADGVVYDVAGGQSHWIALDLPAVQAPRNVVLTLPRAGLDRVNFYWQGPSGEWLMIRAGDQLPVMQWPLPYLHPAFAWTLYPGQGRVFLNVDHGQPTGLSWRLWSREQFDAHAQRWHLGLGAYFGVLMLATLLCLIQGLWRRDTVALVHALCSALTGLALASMVGLAGEMLWPDSAVLNHHAPLVLAPLAVGSVAALVAAMVRGQVARRWVRLQWGLAGLSVPVALVLVGFSRHAPLAWVGGYYLLVMALSLWPLVLWVRRQPHEGGWLLAGYLVLMGSAAVPAWRHLGWWPVSDPSMSWVQAGAALALPLWWGALLVRSRHQQDAMTQRQVLNRLDPLTGLLSERVILERLDHLIARQQRSPKQGAVLRVRISNLPQIQHEEGLHVAEAVVLQAARCVTQLARRSGDSVGRLSDGDFLLIMEGVSSPQVVQDAGQIVIARGLMEADSLPKGMVLKLHVAATSGRYPGCEAPSLLARLAGLLVQMGQGSGRALHLLLPSAVPPAPPGGRDNGLPVQSHA